MIRKNYTDNFLLLAPYGNGIAEEYSMKSIGKNNLNTITINNEKLTIVEINFLVELKCK